MLLTLEAMANRVLDVLQVAQAEKSRTTSQFAASKIVGNLNAVYNELCMEAQEKRRRELLAYENAVLDSTSKVLDKRLNPSMGQLLALTYRTSDSTTPTSREWLLMLHGVNEGVSFLDDQQYFPQGNGDIVLPDQSHAYWRIWWLREMAPMFQATASSGTVNSITLPSTATYGDIIGVGDYYNGSIVYISAGTGSGQYARVTDYDGTTRTLTCSPYLTSTGDAFNTAPSSDSVVSLVPWFPSQFRELLCLMAAARFHKNDQSSQIMSEMAQNYERWRRWLMSSDRSTPKRVINQGRVNVGVGPMSMGNLPSGFTSG